MKENDLNYLVHSFSEKNSYSLLLEKNFEYLDLKKIKKNTILKLEDFFTTEENNSISFSDLLKKEKNEKRILNKKQINTGNIGIDMTNPIFEGSYNLIKCDEEKKNIFLKNIISQNKNKKYIYFSLNFSKLSKFENLAKKRFIKSKYKLNNFNIF